MNKGDVQSVILNFNKNYANSKGYQFTQLVNQQLEIKPYSMVALYGGNLVRKPIVLSEDTELTLNFSSSLPSPNQILQITLNQNLIAPTTIKATIAKGTYSKLTFCRKVVELVNAQIDILNGQETDVYPFDGGDPALQNIPYRMFYEMKNEEFYLGLRYVLNEDTNLNLEDNYPISFLDLNDDCNTS